MTYPVTVLRTKRTEKRALWKLYFYGLHRDGYNSYSGRVSKKAYRQIDAYCKAKHMKLRLNNGFGERSTDYRTQFFAKHHPFMGKWYFCAYCGKIQTSSSITVDHLYPVSMAQKSIDFQKKMKRKGFITINDPRNLVPACARCNMKKGAKMGTWIIRGKIGRYNAVGVARHVIRIVAIIMLVRFVWNAGGIVEAARSLADTIAKEFISLLQLTNSTF